jgi:hypothetical protein
LVLPLLERLGLRELINRRCHPAGAPTAALELGLVTGVLVVNRLLAPQPLVHVETWLAGTALHDLWGFDALQGNDDRLARTLDALAPHLDALWQDVIVAAMGAFGLDLAQLAGGRRRAHAADQRPGGRVGGARDRLELSSRARR